MHHAWVHMSLTQKHVITSIQKIEDRTLKD